MTKLFLGVEYKQSDAYI